jgi:hypothetical protein
MKRADPQQLRTWHAHEFMILFVSTVHRIKPNKANQNQMNAFLSVRSSQRCVPISIEEFNSPIGPNSVANWQQSVQRWIFNKEGIT